MNNVNVTWNRSFVGGNAGGNVSNDCCGDIGVIGDSCDDIGGNVTVVGVLMILVLVMVVIVVMKVVRWQSQR